MSDESGELFRSALEAAAAIPRVTNLWYNNKTVYLDGYEFVECRFDACNLHVDNAAAIHLDRCHINKDCHFIYGNSSLSAIRLFNKDNEWYYENNHLHWVPDRDSQGRFSLNKHPWNPFLPLILQKRDE